MRLLKGCKTLSLSEKLRELRCPVGDNITGVFLPEYIEHKAVKQSHIAQTYQFKIDDCSLNTTEKALNSHQTLFLNPNPNPNPNPNYASREG